MLQQKFKIAQNTEELIHPKSKTKRGLAKKMTGMINSIKDAFPTFEDEQDGKCFANLILISLDVVFVRTDFCRF